MPAGPATPFWSNRRNRAVVWQVLAVAFAVTAFVWLGLNTAENLNRLNIASGFGFWDTTAGFGITMSLISYAETSSYGRAFLVGLLNTLLVSAIGIVLATLLGFIIGIGRLSSNWLIARLAAVYIETIRNVPLLLQLFFWYFAVLRALPSPRQSHAVWEAVFLNNRGLYAPAPLLGGAGLWIGLAGLACVIGGAALLMPARRRPAMIRCGLGAALGLPLAMLLGVFVLADWQQPVLRGFNFQGGIVLIPELASLVLALSIYTAAFIAENVRSGILSVPRGQVEAGRALGLGEGQVTRLIVVPLALRVVVPPLTNQYLNLTKNSSLAAAIAYPDLVSVFAGTVLNQTGQAVEVIAITMAVYLAISLSIAGAMNMYNRWITRTGL